MARPANLAWRTFVSDGLQLSDKCSALRASPLRANPRFGPDEWLLRGPTATHAKMRASHEGSTMDIERINQIGNDLADLSERTEALRRYL